MARECPKCFAEMPGRAKFCPRCGRNVADVPEAAAASVAPAKSFRELFIGWLFFGGGAFLVLAGIFRRGPGWAALGLGIAALVVGLGCLVGDDDEKVAKRRRTEEKQRRRQAKRARREGKARGRDDQS